MRNYHPKSWSQQAREMSYQAIKSIEAGWNTIETTKEYFSNSYCHPLIRNRAAKHYGRMIRTGKVHENLTEYYKHFPEGNPYNYRKEHK